MRTHFTCKAANSCCWCWRRRAGAVLPDPVVGLALTHCPPPIRPPATHLPNLSQTTNGWSRSELLRLLGSLEAGSSHPLAAAVIGYAAAQVGGRHGPGCGARGVLQAVGWAALHARWDAGLTKRLLAWCCRRPASAYTPTTPVLRAGRALRCCSGERAQRAGRRHGGHCGRPPRGSRQCCPAGHPGPDRAGSDRCAAGY